MLYKIYLIQIFLFEERKLRYVVKRLEKTKYGYGLSKIYSCIKQNYRQNNL